MRTFKLLAVGIALIMAAPAFASKIPSAARTDSAPAVAHKATKSCAAKCSKSISRKHGRNVVAKKAAAR
jgi:hypothetical protein